jgi:hypothetical protein
MYYPYLRGRQFVENGTRHYCHVDVLIPLVKKLARGRKISGLTVYE